MDVTIQEVPPLRMINLLTTGHRVFDVIGWWHEKDATFPYRPQRSRTLFGPRALLLPKDFYPGGTRSDRVHNTACPRRPRSGPVGPESRSSDAHKFAGRAAGKE